MSNSYVTSLRKRGLRKLSVEIPFCGPAYKDRYLSMSAQECTNFYLRPFPDFSPTGKGTQKYALVGTPGLTQWIDLGTDSPIRGMLQYGSLLYVVSKNKLFSVTTGAVATEIGTLNTSTGRVGMATNGVDLIVVDGTNGYTWTYGTTTFAVISDVDYPDTATVVAYIDGYYLVVEPSTGRIWRSAFNDGTSWDSLLYGEAGSSPDNVVSILEDRGDIWVFGDKTTEPWYNTGGSGFNFAMISGAKVEFGVISKFGRTKTNNAVYWLGINDDGYGQILQALGRQPSVVSTLPISYSLQSQSLADLQDCSMFSYQMDGHIFVVVNFPSITWVYDTTTGLWHRRTSRSVVDSEVTEGRWRADCHSFFNGKNLVGDYYLGKIFEMSPTVYTDDGYTIIASRTTQTSRYMGEFLTYKKLEIQMETGVGLVDGSDPQIMLSWSDDGGRTWSTMEDGSYYGESFGRLGEFSACPTWFQLGQGRDRVWKVSISDAVQRVIRGAVAEIEVDR